MPRALAVWALAALLLAPAGAGAQTSCTPANTAALLSQFSDNAAPASITPANVRNVICSQQQNLANGGTPLAQTLTSSPFTFVAPGAGTLIVSSGAVTITRNAVTTTPGVLGGAFQLSFADQVTVTWFSTTVPVVTFLPNGQ